MELDAHVATNRAERKADSAVKGNSRVTSSNAAVLSVVLVAEGFALLGVRQMLTRHAFSRISPRQAVSGQ